MSAQSSSALSPDPQQQLQQNKDLSQFFLTNDYFKTLLLYKLDQGANESSSISLDEATVKDVFKVNEKLNSVIQNVYFLYGSKSLLIVCKEAGDLDLVAQLIETEVTLSGIKLTRQCLQGAFGTTSIPPLLLTSEVHDSQLSLISDEKYVAIKTIEAKTGLKLKKVKKSIYFSGLLFQFNMLSELLAECYEQKKSTIKPDEGLVKPLVIEEKQQVMQNFKLLTVGTR